MIKEDDYNRKTFVTDILTEGKKRIVMTSTIVHVIMQPSVRFVVTVGEEIISEDFYLSEAIKAYNDLE